jgi:Na+/proline symporter
MVGAVILAVASVQAAGGLAALAERLHGNPALSVLPPAPQAGEPFLTSPLGWWLGLVLVQWWAWKNADGGGVVVQRLVSCRDERQATLSVLWFNIAHYCLRSWPWIMTGLASLILVPDELLTETLAGSTFVDHERAYPRLIMLLLPVGLRGILVASFFAAFLSTFSTQLNWGASYLLNDVYKRFMNRAAPERHYLLVARLLPYGLSAGAMAVAFSNQSIGGAFTWVLNLTAGIGPVLLLRWFWWRINPWSEIAAMTASLPVLLARPHVFAALGWPPALLLELLFMVFGTALVWLPSTLLTAPVDRETLRAFYARVQPPGWWKGARAAARAKSGLGASLRQWAIGTTALLAATVGPLQVMLGERIGWLWCGVAVVGWWIVLKGLFQKKPS